MSYNEWIKTNVDVAYGRCAAMTLAMQETFTELERKRGHYHCPIWGPREHWWLVAPDGRIVDPTASQFPSKGLGEYVEWEGEEPTGICLECGEYCYDLETFCSMSCQTSYMNYLGAT